jgi:hypothetical protein
MKHGTIGCYTNHKCRCDECRSAWATWQRRARQRRRTSGAAAVHGTVSTYTNHACRCVACRRAARVRKQVYDEDGDPTTWMDL